MRRVFEAHGLFIKLRLLGPPPLLLVPTIPPPPPRWLSEAKSFLCLIKVEFQLNINLWTHYSDVFHHNLLFEIFCQKQFNLNDSWNLIVFLQSFRSATLLGSTTWWRRWLWRTIFQKEAKIILCPPGRATGTIPTPWGSCHASRWTSASWNTHLCNLCWPEDAGSWAAKNDGKKIV